MGITFRQILSPGQQQRLLGGKSSTLFRPRSEILLQEDRSEHAYYIVQGRVAAVYSHPDGRQQLEAVLGPGDLVGEFPMLDSQPRCATVRAIDACSVYSLRAGDFLRIGGPRVQSELLGSYVTGKIRGRQVRPYDIMHLKVPARLAMLLLMCVDVARTRMGDRLTLPLRHEDLAVYLGVSKSSVDGAMRGLTGRGLIRSEHRAVVVTDVDGLRRFVERAA
ncbi:Crp/Fnr family transcriptional regulator [Kutzneria sp. 744]|uniref:Crp/Fnr family transcriptional regulator n=1 Tax=Kutzneria sp. (strain 744) TaxID=345341 RepID=UPI0004BB08C6|nr:Crp/Fnr family transcriptional regulator [Kutzneria sp. 744]